MYSHLTDNEFTNQVLARKIVTDIEQELLDRLLRALDTIYDAEMHIKELRAANAGLEEDVLNLRVGGGVPVVANDGWDG